MVKSKQSLLIICALVFFGIGYLAFYSSRTEKYICNGTLQTNKNMSDGIQYPTENHPLSFSFSWSPSNKKLDISQINQLEGLSDALAGKFISSPSETGNDSLEVTDKNIIYRYYGPRYFSFEYLYAIVNFERNVKAMNIHYTDKITAAKDGSLVDFHDYDVSAICQRDWF